MKEQLTCYAGRHLPVIADLVEAVDGVFHLAVRIIENQITGWDVIHRNEKKGSIY